MKPPLPARAIFEQRMADQFWGLGQRTSNRKNLAQGDRVVFYIGNPQCVFGGTAVLKSPSFTLSKDEKLQLGHGMPFFMADFGVRLADIDIWEHPHSAPAIVPQLSFIENKEYWGTYFQGGTRGISEADYNLIIGAAGHPLGGGRDDARLASQFALEAHLEEFIAENWSHIPWGAKLKLFKSDESDGRQFPAGQWSIDFLALDEASNELVVIELKRGQTSDQTVGQVLRYIGWVRENIADSNQKVRGLIVCKEIDDGLRYAVKAVEGVSVLTYEVSFALKPAKL